jgi:hypothetical protein
LYVSKLFKKVDDMKFRRATATEGEDKESVFQDVLAAMQTGANFRARRNKIDAPKK